MYIVPITFSITNESSTNQPHHASDKLMIWTAQISEVHNLHINFNP